MRSTTFAFCYATGILLFFALLCNSALAATWNSPSGKLSDVQNTVNSAASGDTVIIPSGTFVWNGTLSITKSLVLQGQGVTSTFINRATPISFQDELVAIEPSADIPIRITGINFNNENIGQNYDGLATVSVFGPSGGLTKIRIDHCDFTGGENAAQFSGWAYGVIDHCTFTDCPYAVVSYADGDAAWARPIVFGTSNEVYVEDCTFIMDSRISYFDTLTDEDFGGRMCMRYCTIDFSKFTAAYEFGSVWMVHGNQAFWSGNQQQDNVRGAIALELYNNSVVTNQAYRIVYLRGGQTVVYNNNFTFPNSSPPIVSMTEEEGYNGPGGGGGWDWFNPIRATWPAEDQVNNTFFWGNTVNGVAQNSGDYSNWQTPQDNIFIQPGRDYWLTPPSSSTVTHYPPPAPPSSSNYSSHAASAYYPAVTSYTAFTYPHPLTDSGFTGGGGASSSPTPTPTPKPTPTPTPTPTPKPTPTPTPTPTPSYSVWENELYSEMRTLRIFGARISRIKIWIAFHSPTLSGSSYSAWENELFSKMKSIRIGSKKIAEVESWVQSSPPPS